MEKEELKTDVSGESMGKRDEPDWLLPPVPHDVNNGGKVKIMQELMELWGSPPLVPTTPTREKRRTQKSKKHELGMTLREQALSKPRRRRIANKVMG